MDIHLTDEQVGLVQQTLDFFVDDLDTKIESTDDLAWRRVLRQRRDHLDIIRRQLAARSDVGSGS